MPSRWDLLPDDVQARIWLFEKARRIQEFGVDRAVIDDSWERSLHHRKRYVTMMYRCFAAYCGVDSSAGSDVNVWEHSPIHARVMTRFELRHPLFVPPCASWGMRTNEFRSICDVLALEVTHDQVRRAAHEAPHDHYHAQWWPALSSTERQRIGSMF